MKTIMEFSVMVQQAFNLGYKPYYPLIMLLFFNIITILMRHVLCSFYFNENLKFVIFSLENIINSI